jgi:DNA-binding NarL/FixJ family response regulator
MGRLGGRFPRADGDPVTPAQERTLCQFARTGDANKALAWSLGCAEATVKVHIAIILRETGVTNRAQLMRWAMQNGYGNRWSDEGGELPSLSATMSMSC